MAKMDVPKQSEAGTGLVGILQGGRFRNQSLFLLLVIVAISILISITNVQFISSRNVLNILQQISVTGIVTIGMGMVLTSGGIDLSVGAMISLTCAVVAKLIVSDVSPWMAAPIGLAAADPVRLHQRPDHIEDPLRSVHHYARNVERLPGYSSGGDPWPHRQPERPV